MVGLALQDPIIILNMSDTCIEPATEVTPQTATTTSKTIYQRLTLHRYRHKVNPRHHKHQQGLVVSSKYPSVRPCVCHKFTCVLTLISVADLTVTRFNAANVNSL